MENLQSLKFSFVEDNLRQMIVELTKNQNFLRYTQYLSDFPLENSCTDDDDNVILQPDITDIDLISSKKIFLSLFNPTIIDKAQIYMYLSPIKGSNKEGQPLVHNRYLFDFIVPYANLVLGDSGLRMFRIASEVCKSWDNKYIAGMGRVIMYDYLVAPVDAVYQGMKLYFKVDDSAFTEDYGE